MNQAQRSALGPRPRRLDPHLYRHWNRDRKPYVLHKIADEMLDGLLSYGSGSMTQVASPFAPQQSLEPRATAHAGRGPHQANGEYGCIDLDVH